MTYSLTTSLPYRSTSFVVGLTLGLTCLGLSDALALTAVDLADQIEAVDKTTKSIAHVGLWAVVVLTGIIGIYKQSGPMLGTTLIGALVVHKLSAWITASFTLTI